MAAAETKETTQAYVIESVGAPFKLMDIPLEPLRDTEVQVEISHVGLCHTDIHMQNNDWGISDFPMVAGHEGIGSVVAIGSRVQSIAVGDVVGIGWVRNACGACDQCLEGSDNNCKYGYQGTYLGPAAGMFGREAHQMHGAFARKVNIEARFAVKVPKTMPRAETAPLLCAGETLWEGIMNYAKPGSKVGIRTIGGLGTIGIQLAAAIGCEVYALSAEDKKRAALEAGAHHYIDTRVPEEYATIKNELDVILDTSPFCSSPDGVEDMAKWMDLLVNAGKYIRIGLPKAECSEFKYNSLALTFSGKGINGSIVCSPKNANRMVSVCHLNKIKCDVEVLPFDQVNKAVDDLVNHRNTHSRYVLMW